MDSAPSHPLASVLRLDGRNAVVTGAGAGLGRAIAIALAQQRSSSFDQTLARNRAQELAR